MRVDDYLPHQRDEDTRPTIVLTIAGPAQVAIALSLMMLGIAMLFGLLLEVIS